MFTHLLQLCDCNRHALCCITPSKFCNDDKQKSTLRERGTWRSQKESKRALQSGSWMRVTFWMCSQLKIFKERDRERAFLAVHAESSYSTEQLIVCVIMPNHDVLPPAHYTYTNKINTPFSSVCFSVPDEHFADRALLGITQDYLIDEIVPIEPVSRIPLRKHFTYQAHLVGCSTKWWYDVIYQCVHIFVIA